MSRHDVLKILIEAMKEEIRQVHFGEVTVVVGIKDGVIRTSKVATSKTQLHHDGSDSGGPRSA